MDAINAKQVKAARALLGWSQGDLAKIANVGLTTIRSLEDKYSIRRGLMDEIQKTLQRAGIEFLDNEGVRLHPTDGAKIYKGPNSCRMLMDDMLQTVREKGGDIFSIIRSQGVLMRLSVITDNNNLERLRSVRETVNIKCLSPSMPAPEFTSPPFQFRKPFADAISPSCYIVYGNKRAEITLDADKNPIFVVYSGAAAMADEHRQYLLSLWESALPHQVQTSSRKQRPANI
jgi:hypothetical protein